MAEISDERRRQLEVRANSLNNSGAAYSRKGDKAAALDYYQQALALYREIGEKQGEATALNNIGLMYVAIEDRAQGVAYLSQAVALYQQLGELAQAGRSEVNLARAYEDTGEDATALGHYRHALTVLAGDDHKFQSLTCSGLARLASKEGDLKRAISYYEQATQGFLSIEDWKSAANNLNSCALLYSRRGEKQLAISRYEQAASLFERAGASKSQATAYTNIATVYTNLGLTEKAGHYLEAALYILRERGDHEGEARLLTRLGNLSLTMGDTAKAGLYMQQSLAAMKPKSEDEQSQASELRFNAAPDQPGVLIAEPVGHFKLDDYIARVVSLSRLLGKDTLADTTEQAADWRRRAAKDPETLKSGVTLSLEHELTERQQKRDRSGEADTLSQLGMAYGMSGDLPAALSYLEPAAVIYRELGKPQALAANLDYRAVLYSQQGDHARAISNGEEALQLYLQLEDEEGQSEALVHLGEAQLAAGAPAQATPYFARAAQLLAELDDPEAVAYSFYRLGECYQQTGQPQEAQGVLNQALKAADMLSDKGTRVKILASMMGISQELLNWEGVTTYGEQALASLPPDDSVHIGPILISLGEAYIHIKEPDKARGYLEQALVMAQQAGNNNLAQAAQYILAEIGE